MCASRDLWLRAAGVWFRVLVMSLRIALSAGPGPLPFLGRCILSIDLAPRGSEGK